VISICPKTGKSEYDVYPGGNEKYYNIYLFIIIILIMFTGHNTNKT